VTDEAISQMVPEAWTIRCPSVVPPLSYDGRPWAPGEVCLTINGERPNRWQVIEQEGNILDIPVKHRHDKKAAKKYFRELRRDSA
jgi:transposase-like protein